MDFLIYGLFNNTLVSQIVHYGCYILVWIYELRYSKSDGPSCTYSTSHAKWTSCNGAEWINTEVQYVIQGADTSTELKSSLGALQNECGFYLSLIHSCHCGGSGSMPDQSMWGFWWTQWQWNTPSHPLALLLRHQHFTNSPYFHLNSTLLSLLSVIRERSKDQYFHISSCFR
jgi:hypothetical protein